MGVTGLWKLIEPCGQPVPVETLEGKILAIDISIWLHQVVKGFQDNKGSALANAHLLGLFHRLCKLMYYRIKPIFVFDGKVPLLKKETIAKRNLARSKLNNEANRIQVLLLQSLAKEKVVQQALGPKAAAELLKASPTKNVSIPKRPDVDDIFKLPDLPNTSSVESTDYNTSSDTICSSDVESSFEESRTRTYHSEDLQSIDVKSKYFCNLPADIRHEILVDIKETRKQSSWGKLHELPSKGCDFSSFQMKRLLKRRQVQESLEEVEKEMDGVRSFTLNELENIFNEEGIIEASSLPNSKHISCDTNTRFLLIRDLKKTLANASTIEHDEKPHTSTAETDESSFPKKEKDLDLEYESDIQKAIQMSLEKCAPYSENDYENNGNLRLRKEQRANLADAAVGLAKAYMIEHAGMNEEDIQALLECTQACSDDELNFTFGLSKQSMENSFKSRVAESESDIATEVKNSPPHCTPLKIEEQETSEIKEKNKKSEETHVSYQNSPKILKPIEESVEDEIGVISDSSVDSELEEVSSNKSLIKKEQKDSTLPASLEIFVDSSKNIRPEEDLFGDIFAAETVNKIEPTSSKNATNILADLKKQALEETKINLTDIKLDPSIIEISDDENLKCESEIGKKGIKTDQLPVNKDHKSENSLELLINETEKKVTPFDSKEMNKKTEAKKGEMEEDIEVVADQSIESEKVLTAETANNIKPKTSTDITEILKDLKKQAEEVTKINLTDIKFDPSIVENPLSNEPVKKIISETTNISSDEIIEILDDPITTKTPPNCKTPSKTKPISDFFEAEYFIKRTPEKACEPTQDVPIVKSPFFVKKKGKRSSTNDEGSPSKKSNKTAKMLFENSNDESSKLKAQNEVDKAANVLKENKTTEELEGLASTLAREKTMLEMEKNRQERMGMTISERMNSECMHLLRLFGVPFIAAPMEAEAQCAFLDAMQLTNGTITDDSDIWLFGGQTVYKNFFAQNKHVMEFKSDKIENSFNVDRNKLIQLALLVGSDYTTGINGIGAVTALEIIASFTSSEVHGAVTSQQTTSVLETLRNFRDWWESVRSNKAIGNSTRHRLRNKLKNIELSEGFPNPAVVEQYLTPTVDKSKETFSWGVPDVESIKEFTRTNFGWTRRKTDEILEPVLKKFHEKKTQATIRNYFAVKSACSKSQIAVSKRVQNAINKMSTAYKSDEEKDDEAVPKKPKRRKAKQGAASSTACSSKEVVPKKRKASATKKLSNSSASTDEIPQRQVDITEMEKRKKLAAEILKKSDKKVNK